MLIRLLFFVLLCSLSFSALAQRVEKVTGEYVYYAPENLSLEEAKRTALERAKIQAIADAFGTIISQNNFTTVASRNGESNVDFLSLGSSEVKGEWIETIGKPKYAITYEEGMLVINVSVSGRIREVVNARVDFTAKVLCNGTDPKFERSDFRSGDDLYLYFRSPVNGYLNVYLLDEVAETVYCLLPYRKSADASVYVEHDVPYLFFSKEKTTGKAAEVDEYVMTCSREVENNMMYIVFSPNIFAKTVLDETGNLLPRQVKLADFQKWLAKCRRKDKDMIIEQIALTISND